MKQEYELGRVFKDRYVEKYKLLNSSYVFNEVDNLLHITVLIFLYRLCNIDCQECSGKLSMLWVEKCLREG